MAQRPEDSLTTLVVSLYRDHLGVVPPEDRVMTIVKGLEGEEYYTPGALRQLVRTEDALRRLAARLHWSDAFTNALAQWLALAPSEGAPVPPVAPPATVAPARQSVLAPIWSALAGVTGSHPPPTEPAANPTAAPASAAPVPVAPAAAPTYAGPSAKAEVFLLKVKNASRLAEEFYVLGKGQDPAYYKDASFTMVESYMLFDGRGRASFVPATRAEASGKYAKRLSEFPTDPKDPTLRVITIPKTIGGRIYFSLGEPVVLAVVAGRDASGRPVSKTLAEPDPFKLDDPSYLTVYDKVEFTFNDLGVWIDTTAVDFFCMPISLHYEGAPASSVGLTKPRAAILETLRKEFPGPWANLRLAYANPDQREAVLRVLAPNKAIGRKATAENFPDDYLTPYLRAVWDHYRAGGAAPGPRDAVLRVDCGELVGFGHPLADVAGGKLTKETAVYTGWVTPDGTTFHFENAAKDKVDVTLPHSNEVFGCDGGSMTCIPNRASSVVVRELGAALTVGLLPLPTQMPNPATGRSEDVALCKPFFTRPDVRKLFYTSSPLLPGSVKGPYYNVYSKALHSFGERVYAFAFDDAVGEDSTLHSSDDDTSVPNVSVPYIMCIGDMTGTVLPDLRDDKRYSITLAPGWGGKGAYVTPDGHSQPFAWPGSLTVSNVPSPFFLDYDLGEGLNHYEVTVAVRRVRCTTSPSKVSLGVDWHFSGLEGTIALEGAPR